MGDKQNSNYPPSKEDLSKTQSKSIMRHYKKLAKDVLDGHKKNIDENIDDVKAKMDIERSKKAAELAKENSRYGVPDNYSTMSYLSNFYKERADKHAEKAKHRNKYGDDSLFGHHYEHKFKGSISPRRTDYGGDQYNYDSSRDRTLHSIAKHLKRKGKMSESLMLDIIERAESIIESLHSQAYKVADHSGLHLNQKDQDLIDKAFDAQYGINKYKRDPLPHKLTKNELGAKKTDMRRKDGGTKSEKEAIEASQFRHANRTSKERRAARKAIAEIERIQAAERAVGA